MAETLVWPPMNVLTPPVAVTAPFTYNTLVCAQDLNPRPRSGSVDTRHGGESAISVLIAQINVGGVSSGSQERCSVSKGMRVNGQTTKASNK